MAFELTLQSNTKIIVNGNAITKVVDTGSTRSVHIGGDVQVVKETLAVILQRMNAR